MAKVRGVENKEWMRAKNEQLRSNVAVPQESRNKRLRTDERIIARELKEENDGQEQQES